MRSSSMTDKLGFLDTQEVFGTGVPSDHSKCVLRLLYSASNHTLARVGHEAGINENVQFTPIYNLNSYRIVVLNSDLSLFYSLAKYIKYSLP